MRCHLPFRVRGALVGIALLALALSSLQSADAKPPMGATEEMVPMRDGVKLATNVYLPKGEGPFHVVLTRTPYGKDAGLSLASNRYLKQDYAYVVQDCRGRFASEGEYKTFENDRDDGFDTITWIAKQPWCNGKVGMSGASAMGITSLLAAISQPEALKCAYVIVAPESFWTEATFIGGVFKEADTTGWLKSQGVADTIPARREPGRTESRARAGHLSLSRPDPDPDLPRRGLVRHLFGRHAGELRLFAKQGF